MQDKEKIVNKCSSSSSSSNSNKSSNNKVNLLGRYWVREQTDKILKENEQRHKRKKGDSKR